VRPHDDRIVELEGRQVSLIELIGLVRIHFDERADMQLVLESAFEISDEIGTTSVVFSPATRTPPHGLDRLGALFGATVDRALVAPDGSLAVTFQDGTILTLPVDPHFEAGHLILLDQCIVVPPGGR
jgi:hypothetical protein